MKKKVLVVASVISFIEWFNKENLMFLKNTLNCEVHVACNFDYMDDTDEDKTITYIDFLKKEGFILHNIPFSRSPFSIKNLNVYGQLKKILKEIDFDLLHCHTPTASMIARYAARKHRNGKLKVMYTCHGFHFHKKSKKLNWLIYYPVEKYFSKVTDVLITINKEDFNTASKFKCKHIKYIHGVGVDIAKIKSVIVEKESYRKKINIPNDAILISSFGELIPRKNHEVIIKAMAEIKNPNIYYVICGKGSLHDKLKKLIIKLKMEDNIKLIGFRNDIAEICKVSDIGAFPSKIEGLGLAGIELMAAGVPLVSSNVHGILDYVIDGVTGYTCDPKNVKQFIRAIMNLVDDEKLRLNMGKNGSMLIDSYSKENALNEMWNIYSWILKGE